jgi:hypothetical protein
MINESWVYSTLGFLVLGVSRDRSALALQGLQDRFFFSAFIQARGAILRCSASRFGANLARAERRPDIIGTVSLPSDSRRVKNMPSFQGASFVGRIGSTGILTRASRTMLSNLTQARTPQIQTRWI